MCLKLAHKAFASLLRYDEYFLRFFYTFIHNQIHNLLKNSTLVCIVKDQLNYPPLLSIHFQQGENQKLQKSETRIFEDDGTLTKINVQVIVKAKALSCWIFENVPNGNCSLLTEKKTKSRRQNEPENSPTKEQGKGNWSERRERKEQKKKKKKKKAMAALLVFMLTSV